MYIYIYIFLYLCRTQFQDLERIGYSGFALGYFQEDIQLVGTQAAINSISSALLEYLHAVIVAGKEIYETIM